MSIEATKAIAEADWAELGPKILRFADGVIAQYKWRGLRVETSSDKKLTIEGRSAEDFVQVALNKLCGGKRKYLPEKDLSYNLRFTVESLIANFHKRAKGLPVQDRTLWDTFTEEEDPIETVADPFQVNHPGESQELMKRQKAMLMDFEKYIENDEDLALILMAYGDDKYKPSEIEEATGISAKRVCELKRKLAQRAHKFLREYPQFADLKPLKEAP